MSKEKIRTLALELIRKESTMALATARENTAWAAPVYYVLFQSAFFFFSSPDSRHILETIANKQAAATIYPSASTWRGIRGIQMSGSIISPSPGLEAIRSIKAYLNKFPFTKEFFSPGQSIDLESFRKRFRVKLYKFDPHLIYYLDNEIEFGFRREITL
jgi:uncharacterized protein YhbP (UPF0306 family)